MRCGWSAAHALGVVLGVNGGTHPSLSVTTTQSVNFRAKNSVVVCFGLALVTAIPLGSRCSQSIPIMCITTLAMSSSAITLPHSWFLFALPAHCKHAHTLTHTHTHTHTRTHTHTHIQTLHAPLLAPSLPRSCRRQIGRPTPQAPKLSEGGPRELRTWKQLETEYYRMKELQSQYNEVADKVSVCAPPLDTLATAGHTV
jgi:hypothetical protein